MPKNIAVDATIETVWPHLARRKEYVSGALHKLRQCNKIHGNAFVKTGVTGTGRKPYYRISYDSSDGERIFGSFYDNHSSMENGFADSKNWSSERLPFDRLLEFYAKAIGYVGELN